MHQWLTHCLLETFKDFLVSLSLDKQHKMFTVSTVTTVSLCLLITSLWSFLLLKALYCICRNMFCLFLQCYKFFILWKKTSLCFGWGLYLLWDITLFDHAVFFVNWSKFDFQKLMVWHQGREPITSFDNRFLHLTRGTASIGACLSLWN